MSTSTVSQVKVAERAYELFKERGGSPGSAEADWYTAEQEVLKANEAAVPKVQQSAPGTQPSKAKQKPQSRQVWS